MLFTGRVGDQDFYFEKIRVFKATLHGLVNRLAWDNPIRSSVLSVIPIFSGMQIMINRNGLGVSVFSCQR